MNSIKTLAIVAMLAAIGVGLYIKINSSPPPEPPAAAAGTWDAPPPIDMGSIDAEMSGMTEMPSLSADGSAGGLAPSFDAAGATSTAPPFDSGGTAPAYEPAAAGDAPAFNAAGPGGAAPPFNAGADAAPSAAGETAPPFDAQSSTATPARGASDNHVTNDPFVQPVSGAGPSQQNYSSYDEAFDQAQKLLQQDELDAAHKLLSSWYGDAAMTPTTREQLVDLLSQLAGTLIYSGEHHLEPAYTVREGETLDQIAQRYQITPQLLAKINGLSAASRLEPGQQLKVVRGPFMAFVSIAQRELTLALDGRYAGRFSIGVAQEWQPVEGEFEVKTKYTNPTYFGRNETIDAGNPDNPLGEHWVGLVSKDSSYGGPLGIHGASQADGGRQDDPRGYIRLAPHEAEDVFDILSVGSRVIIRR